MQQQESKSNTEPFPLKLSACMQPVQLTFSMSLLKSHFRSNAICSERLQHGLVTCRNGETNEAFLHILYFVHQNQSICNLFCMFVYLCTSPSVQLKNTSTSIPGIQVTDGPLTLTEAISNTCMICGIVSSWCYYSSRSPKMAHTCCLRKKFPALRTGVHVYKNS